MDELRFSVQSENEVNLGCIAFLKNELLAFIGIDHSKYVAFIYVE